jgi:hypothetical protein
MDLLPEKYFSVGPDSAIQFYAEARLDTIRPISSISLSGQTLSTDFKLADLTLTGDYSGRIRLGLEEILGAPLPEQPVLLPVPPFVFDLERTFSIDRIRSAELLRGVSRIKVSNFSNLTIDSVRLDCQATGVYCFTAIGPGARAEARQRLGGCRISGQNALVLHGRSAGGGSEPVWVSRNDSLIIEVKFDSLRLSSAELQIPPAEARKKLFLGVTASHPFTLDSIAFRRGNAELTLVNNFAFPVDIAVTIAKLAYHDNLHLTPASERTATIDLAGKSLANNSLLNCLLEVVALVSVRPDSGYVRVSKDQRLAVTSKLDCLAPEFLCGDLREPLYITPRQETLPRLLPSGLPALRLPRCRLDLRIMSEIGFLGRLNLHISGANRAGDTARIDKTVYVLPGSPAYPQITECAIPLYHVLTIGPDQVRFSYDLGITGRGSIEYNSCATGKIAVSTPLRLALCADTIDLGGRVVEIDQATRDKIARYLVAGEIQADVGNHFPLGINACVILKSESGDSQGTTDTLSIPIGIPAGAVDANQTCRGQTDTTIVGTIDGPSLAIFHNPKISARVLLYTSDTDTVLLQPQDFLRILSRAVLKLRIGGNHGAN